MDEEPQRLTERPSRGQLAVRRVVALLVLLGVVGVAAWLGANAFGGGDDEAPPPPTTTAAPTLKTLRIVFPEGYTRRQMAARVGEVREIAIARRNVRPRLTETGYATATRRITAPAGFRKDVPSRIPRRVGAGRPSQGAAQEPDAVRRAHHRLDDRA
jgi:hypothetical protein